MNETNAVAVTGDGSPKSKKERSPNYPAIGLQSAIERARQFHRIEKKNAARTTDAMQHWGFTEKSSGGRMVLSSLIKFGLLEEEGRGEDRHVRLSRLALDILLDERPFSAERDDLIKQAALRPKIHAHLWEKYGHELPSEVTLRTYLKRDLGFTDTAVAELIGEYRDTIEYAKIGAGGTIPGGGDRDFDTEPSPESAVPKHQVTYPQPAAVGVKVSSAAPIIEPPPRPADGFKESVLPLQAGAMTIRWPDQLSPEEVEDIEDWFRIVLRKVKRAARKETPPTGGE